MAVGHPVGGRGSGYANTAAFLRSSPLAGGR